MELNLLNDQTSTQKLIEITRKMIAGETDRDKYTYQGVEKYVFYHPVEWVDWSLGLTVPVEELTVAARELTQQSIIGYLALFIIISIIVYLVTGSIAKNNL